MPVTQNELDTVLSLIPADIKKAYLVGSTDGVIQFTTIKLETTTSNPR